MGLPILTKSIPVLLDRLPRINMADWLARVVGALIHPHGGSRANLLRCSVVARNGLFVKFAFPTAHALHASRPDSLERGSPGLEASRDLLYTKPPDNCFKRLFNSCRK